MARLFRCPDDSLMIQESFRATLLDSRGAVIRTWRRRTDVAMRGLPSFYGVSRDCSSTLWSWTSRPSVIQASGRGTLWQMKQVGWVPPGEGTVDSVGLVLWGELREDGWGYPFPLMPSVATDGELAFYGPGEKPEVQVIDRDGNVVRVIRWATSPAPITEGFSGTTRSSGPRPRSTARPSRPAGRHEACFPMTQCRSSPKPGICRAAPVPALLTDGEGNLWVRQYAPVPYTDLVPGLRGPLPAQRWWVFDPQGHWLGEVETPENLLIRSYRERTHPRRFLG